MPHHIQDFSLIETILWEKRDFFLLDLHLERLEKSARFFGFPFEWDKVLGALEKTASTLSPDKDHRVRMLLGPLGNVSIAHSPLEPAGEVPFRASVSDKQTDPEDIFLYHKTTKRDLYDTEHAECRKAGFFDVIFLNKRTEIAEGAITNIMIKKAEEYWTPPVSSGLLPGVFREYLLRMQALPLKEKVLRMEDLENADMVYLINSVRKIVPVEL